MVFKPRGRELLWQWPGEQVVPPSYGSPFGAEAAWGFDEMFPAILPELYPDEPWRGAPVPDHGEVWSLAWHERLPSGGPAGDAVVHSVHGVRFPYLLTRTASLEGAALTLRYRLENLSPFPMRCLWAAHPLLVIGEGSTVELPGGVEAIVNAQASPGLARYGARYAYPYADEVDHEGVDLRTVPPLPLRGSWKWWVSDSLRDGWGVVRNPAGGYAVRLTFPADRVPYLGMWINNGGWSGQYNCALEPATGGMDGISEGRAFGVGHLLPPLAEEEWHLLVSVESI